MSDPQHEQQAMIEAYAALGEIEDAECARRESVLSLVKARVDNLTYAAIEQCIADSDEDGRAHSFSIVDQPRGDVRNSDYAFGTYHVDQYENGGISGDNYAGSVCIPIGLGQHLEFHYEM